MIVGVGVSVDPGVKVLVGVGVGVVVNVGVGVGAATKLAVKAYPFDITMYALNGSVGLTTAPNGLLVHVVNE